MADDKSSSSKTELFAISISCHDSEDRYLRRPVVGGHFTVDLIVSANQLALYFNLQIYKVGEPLQAHFKRNASREYLEIINLTISTITELTEGHGEKTLQMNQ